MDELLISEYSYVFRLAIGAHEALKQCQLNVNDGYAYVVDMDLEKFFDTVSQSKLIKILSRNEATSNEIRKERLARFIKGWFRYFKLADMRSLLTQVDE